MWRKRIFGCLISNISFLLGSSCNSVISLSASYAYFILISRYKLSIANPIFTLFLLFRDMLLRRKRNEGKDGRTEEGREGDQGPHFSNSHSTCTSSLSGAWMVEERIRVGVMDSVAENWHFNCPLWCVAQIPPQDPGTYFLAARGTWPLKPDILPSF